MKTKFALVAATVVGGLLFAEQAANAQVVIGAGVRPGISVGVGIGGGYYPYAAPAVVYPGPYVVPPAVSVGVGVPIYRPYGGYYHGGYYHGGYYHGGYYHHHHYR